MNTVKVMYANLLPVYFENALWREREGYILVSRNAHTLAMFAPGQWASVEDIVTDEAALPARKDDA